MEIEAKDRILTCEEKGVNPDDLIRLTLKEILNIKSQDFVIPFNESDVENFILNKSSLGKLLLDDEELRSIFAYHFCIKLAELFTEDELKSVSKSAVEVSKELVYNYISYMKGVYDADIEEFKKLGEIEEISQIDEISFMIHLLMRKQDSEKTAGDIFRLLAKRNDLETQPRKKLSISEKGLTHEDIIAGALSYYNKALQIFGDLSGSDLENTSLNIDVIVSNKSLFKEFLNSRNPLNTNKNIQINDLFLVAYCQYILDTFTLEELSSVSINPNVLIDAIIELFIEVLGIYLDKDVDIRSRVKSDDQFRSLLRLSVQLRMRSENL